MALRQIKLKDSLFDDIMKFHKAVLKRTFPGFSITNVYVSRTDLKRLNKAIYKEAKKDLPYACATYLKTRVVPWLAMDLEPSKTLINAIKPGYVIIEMDGIKI